MIALTNSEGIGGMRTKGLGMAVCSRDSVEEQSDEHAHHTHTCV